MKMTLPHLVPLSDQSIAVLKELYVLNGKRDLIFFSQKNPRQSMSDGTMLGALKRIGYNGKMTVHGFRALAMGLLKEKVGYSHDIVDRQLAHVKKAMLTVHMIVRNFYHSELR